MKAGLNRKSSGNFLDQYTSYNVHAVSLPGHNLLPKAITKSNSSGYYPALPIILNDLVDEADNPYP
jgi:hypothetical protein